MGELTGYLYTDEELKKKGSGIIRKTTGNLGKIEIRGTQIICHVNNKRLDKHLEVNGNTLSLNGFTTGNKFFFKQVYGIDKPIKYVIENYHFDDVFLDTVGDTTLQFNNCIFEGNNLNVGYINNIIFYNSCFHLDNELNIFNNINLFNNDNKQIKSVIVIDCNFGNRLSIPGADNIFIVSDRVYINGSKVCSSKDINIKTNEIKISDAVIHAGKTLHENHINIYTNKYEMINSSLIGDNLRIVSPDMKAKNSVFDSRETTIINKNCNVGELNNTSGMIKYNDITLLPKRTYYITPESYELLKERERLTNVLYKLNDKCDNEVKKKVRILKNKSVSDTLSNLI